MSKVYLVTQGDYSDYTVMAAFSTREKAEAVVNVKYNYGACIEEYDLDKPPECHLALRVGIARDGRVMEVEKEFRSQDGSLTTPRICNGLLWVWVRGDDAQRAIKVANEVRGQWIAENKRWPTSHGSWGAE